MSLALSGTYMQAGNVTVKVAILIDLPEIGKGKNSYKVVFYFNEKKNNS
jgi:hypothetical protein